MKKKNKFNNIDIWKIKDSKELYRVDSWGDGYFNINTNGNLVVIPDNSENEIEILQVIEYLKTRNINTPVLLRFPQILESRIHELYESFTRSITEFAYNGTYKGVFPLKVNQHKDVVEEIIRAGKKYHYGLEAGSKPEFIESLFFNLDPEALIICNGYKDKHYIKTALAFSLIRKNIILVIDRIDEIHDIIKYSKELSVNPKLGIRLRLYSKGSGKWVDSGGESAKFGLTTEELLSVIDILSTHNMLCDLKMLHFHIGSQITQIRRIQDAVKEASRIYAKVKQIATDLEYFNIGGGLGIDYEGSKTSADSSTNYSMQEYTNNVVFMVKEICEQEGIEHPTIVSESGRAIAVFHSLLVTHLVSEISAVHSNNIRYNKNDTPIINKFHRCFMDININNYRESYHDSLEYKDELISLFNLGQLSLEDKAKGEALFYKISKRIFEIIHQTKDYSEEFDRINKLMSKRYIGNFSLFQSMPDFWAVDQLFPIMPIQRLDEKPQCFSTILDMTCDSDGEIDKFICMKDIRGLLEIHVPDKQPYYIAVLLLGAYQDAIGDLHNLFGAVHEAHVIVTAKNTWEIKKIIKGDSVSSVLDMLEFNKQSLINNIRSMIHESVEDHVISPQMANNIANDIIKQINDYTYLKFD